MSTTWLDKLSSVKLIVQEMVGSIQLYLQVQFVLISTRASSLA